MSQLLPAATSGLDATDGSGSYLFENPVDGAYVVTPDRAGYDFYPLDAQVVLSGANSTVEDFVGRPLPTGEVGGEESGVFTAVDPGGYNLTPDVGGGPLAF